MVHGGDGADYEPKYPALQQFSRRFADIHGYIAAVVCIWGIVANLANIVVLLHHHQHHQLQHLFDRKCIVQ